MNNNITIAIICMKIDIQIDILKDRWTDREKDRWVDLYRQIELGRQVCNQTNTYNRAKQSDRQTG